MSGTNSTATTQSGMPISSLPEAQDVAATDGVLGVFGGKAQIAKPADIVNAGMPTDVVKTDDLNAALSGSALSQYVTQAATHAASSETSANQSQTASAAASTSAAQAAQTGVQVATIASSINDTAASAQNAVAGVTADANAAKVMLTAALNGDSPLTYKGYWDASTNSPALSSGTGAEGDLYIVSVAGTTNLDGNGAWSVGDGAWFTNGKWVYFARAGWAAVAQEIVALNALGVGDHRLSAGGTGFSICDSNGNVAFEIDFSGNMLAINIGFPDGSILQVAEDQTAPLRLVGSDGTYMDIGLPDTDPVITEAAPDLWLDAGSGLSCAASGTVQTWTSKTTSPWSAAFAAGNPVKIANAIGELPAIHFDGASALSHSLPFTPGTVIAVYRNTTTAGSTQPAIIACDSPMAGTPAYALRGFIPMGVGGGFARAQGYQIGTSLSGGEFAGRVSGALGHWQVLGATYSNDTVTVASGKTHSIPCVKSPAATVLSPGGKSGTIGATYNASGTLTDYFTGDLCELLIWQRALSQREYNAVVDALQSKYSLQPVFGRFLYGAFQTTEAGLESGGVEGLVMLSSDNGIEWQHVPTELIFDSAHTMRDPTITYHNGRFLLACTAGSFGNGYQDRFSVYSSTDGRHWDFVTDVVCTVGGVASHQTWAPEWFHDPIDGVLRLVVHLDIGSAASQIYEMHPTDDTLLNWSTPVLISLTGYSNVIDSFPFYYKDRWVLFFKDESARQIQIATASEPTGPYTVLTTGDWAGWGSGVEGPSVMPLGEDAAGNTMFRIYIDAQGAGISYSDAVGAWPDVLTGAWSAPKLLTVPSNPQHGTCIRNPIPNFGV
ncbi:hypothetical protein ACJRO0_09730 [Acetobacter oryzifermentans]|uniref:hypothetical protein n=1 Tax=Acetobacter oryzifermentans TaxID=1633874 RepID=UPI0039BF2A8B